MTTNTISNERIISLHKSNSNSNKINTLQANVTDDTTATSPTINTTVRPIATTSIIRTSNTTTPARPAACDWLGDIDTHKHHRYFSMWEE